MAGITEWSAMEATLGLGQTPGRSPYEQPHGEDCACPSCCGGHSEDDGHDHISWKDYYGLGLNDAGTDSSPASVGSFGGLRPDYYDRITFDGSQMEQLDFGVTVIDQTGSTSADVLQIFEILTEIALNTWGAFLGAAPGASIEVEVRVGGTSAVASAGSATNFITDYQDNNGNGIFDFGDVGTLIAGSLYEMQTGEDPNGSEADIFVNVNPAYITSGQFFYDITASQPVPSNQIDFYSVILHELGHGFGFFGFSEVSDMGNIPFLNFGSFIAQAGNAYDFLIDYIDGRPYFTGENTMALYGGPVPLEDNQGPGSDISHFLGTEATSQAGINLQWALMNPFVIPGDRVSIGDLDLAVMQDIGHSILQSAGFLINGPGDEGQAVTDGSGGGDDDEFIRGDGDPNDLMGGDGNDTLEGRNGNDTLDGGAGDDSLVGGNDDDSLIGGSGDDTLIGNKDEDTMKGGAGNDTAFGGQGDDSIEGGTGSDTLWGGAENDTIDGGANDDELNGNKGDDLVRGGSGNDLIEGRNGNDSLEGGDGDDTVAGNAGADTLRGGDGNDRLNGGNGADLLIAENGVDRLTGGNGADMFDVSGGERALIFDMQFGIDSIIFDDGMVSSEAELLAYIAANSDVTATATGNNGNNLTLEFDSGLEVVITGAGDLLMS